MDFSEDGKPEYVTNGTEKCEVLGAQNCKQVTLSPRLPTDPFLHANRTPLLQCPQQLRR
jgi:hypothetical protein